MDIGRENSFPGAKTSKRTMPEKNELSHNMGCSSIAI